MKNRIEDLRNHLFETLEGLKDKDDPMDLDRAQAIANVAKEIISSAKVEVEYAKVTGAQIAGGFLEPPRAPESPPAGGNGGQRRLSKP